MVEFALVAPTLFLLVIGLVITSTVVMNIIQLNNAVRDGARAASICGGIARDSRRPPPTMPDGHTPCSTAAVQAFVGSGLQAVPGGVSPVVTINANGASTHDLDTCSYGGTVTLSISYQQPLFFPYLDRLIGDGAGTGVRTITATNAAVCEQ